MQEIVYDDGKGAAPYTATCGYGMVETLEGPLKVTAGDFIITGVKGEKYPYKPDIFAATYEPVE